MLRGLNFGVLGAFVNSLFIIPFYGTFSLYFGQIFVLMCLLTQGLNAAVIAAIISSFAIAYQLDNPFIFIVLFSEMFFIHMLLKKGYFVLPASCVYWIIIGIPLTFFFVAMTAPFNPDVFIIHGLTHGVNGLFCASVTALLYSFLPANSPYRKYRTKPPKFARAIFSLCMLTATLPTLIIALVFTWKTTNSKELEISQKLDRQVQNVTMATAFFIRQQQNSLSLIADVLSKQFDTAKAQELLDSVVRGDSLFESMMVTDSTGQILVASPFKFSRMLQNGLPHTVRDRQYFKDAKQTKQAGISHALSGKGFGNAAILALTAPIIRDDQFVGMVQGAINLDDRRVFNAIFDDLNINSYYVVLDQDKKVVYSSTFFNLPTLANFDYTETTNQIIRSMPSMLIKDQVYIYRSIITHNGWEVYVITEPSEVTHVITDNFYILAISVILTLLLFSFIVNALSKRLTRPLEQLSKYFSDDKEYSLTAEDSQVSEEIVELTEQLVKSKNIMMDFQFHLKKQVEEKTSQLQHLNEQLYTLAQKDGLTNLLNRSGFDELANASYRNCVRNDIPISMVLVDIDFFKKINDTHGHPFGDKCIVAIADTLTKFCKRETDLIGRYGGEEFIVMLVGSTVEEHHTLIKMILATIEKMTIKVDDASVNMTVSVGVSSLKKNFNMSFQGIVNSADEQLYKSKRTGRNRISIYVQ